MAVVFSNCTQKSVIVNPSEFSMGLNLYIATESHVNETANMRDLARMPFEHISPYYFEPITLAPQEAYRHVIKLPYGCSMIVRKKEETNLQVRFVAVFGGWETLRKPSEIPRRYRPMPWRYAVTSQPVNVEFRETIEAWIERTGGRDASNEVLRASMF
jgi:hypothetical protein